MDYALSERGQTLNSKQLLCRDQPLASTGRHIRVQTPSVKTLSTGDEPLTY